METQGEQSNGLAKRKNASRSLSEVSQNTVDKIKRSRTHAKNEPLYTYHDMNSPGYGWLLPGWIAEERHMQSGRIYRYYYDPEGQLYRSQTEVIAAWDKSGMVVIDP